MISLLLYEPQALQIRWGTIRALHLLHFTRVGFAIFQFARRLSRRLLEDLFLGHIAILHLLHWLLRLLFLHTLPIIRKGEGLVKKNFRQNRSLNRSPVFLD
jgi:hypothetical protein